MKLLTAMREIWSRPALLYTHSDKSSTCERSSPKGSCLYYIGTSLKPYLCHMAIFVSLKLSTSPNIHSKSCFLLSMLHKHLCKAFSSMSFINASELRGDRAYLRKPAVYEACCVFSSLFGERHVVFKCTTRALFTFLEL